MPIDHENDLDSFTQPYRKMKAIEETHESNSLLSLYKEEFRKKYKTDPLFPDQYGHLNDLKHFAKMAGNKAHDLIKHFFKMGDWFEKQGHSIESLKKGIGKIQADHGKHSQRTHKGPVIIRMSCGLCGEQFDTQDSFQPTCPKCEREQNENGKTAKAKEIKTEFF